ncbi:ABC transporter ATP-binding protein [Pinirhizobacter sp.]|uniref:ABC transporter ATP-binding protein n=1 Tax=Pinirhizobacter sp. TaxID=2950432 RepID=UPI002F4142AE
MIEFSNVSKRFGQDEAVDGVSLSIASGELFVMVGPSGSGKSTLLRMINRLVEPDEGSVCIDGQDVRNTPVTELRRGIGYAIQSVGLFPHWSVARNIGTVPRLLGWKEDRIASRVAELMAMVELDASIAKRLPAELSGGQQQRVGVARAMAAQPIIVLMDEPFGALDPVTREKLQHAFRRIHADIGTTVVFVTHDMDEALQLGDRIAFIDGGHVRQCGTPLELLLHPADDVVRGFVGGTSAGLRLLSVRKVRDVMAPGNVADGTPSIHAEADLRQALSMMVDRGLRALRVDGAGDQVISLDGLLVPPS